VCQEQLHIQSLVSFDQVSVIRTSMLVGRSSLLLRKRFKRPTVTVAGQNRNRRSL